MDYNPVHDCSRRTAAVVTTPSAAPIQKFRSAAISSDGGIRFHLPATAFSEHAAHTSHHMAGQGFFGFSHDTATVHTLLSTDNWATIGEHGGKCECPLSVLSLKG